MHWVYVVEVAVTNQVLPALSFSFQQSLVTVPLSCPGTEVQCVSDHGGRFVAWEQFPWKQRRPTVTKVLGEVIYTALLDEAHCLVIAYQSSVLRGGCTFWAGGRMLKKLLSIVQHYWTVITMFCGSTSFSVQQCQNAWLSLMRAHNVSLRQNIGVLILVMQMMKQNLVMYLLQG